MITHCSFLIILNVLILFELCHMEKQHFKLLIASFKLLTPSCCSSKADSSLWKTLSSKVHISSLYPYFNLWKSLIATATLFLPGVGYVVLVILSF